jgi:hypothetical protein
MRARDAAISVNCLMRISSENGIVSSFLHNCQRAII